MRTTYGYLNVSTGTGSTFALPTTARLHSIVVGTGASSAVVTVYEGSNSLGSTVAVIDASAKGYYDFECLYLPAGLFVAQTGGNAKTTVVAS